MDAASRETITWILSTMIALAFLFGLATKLVLMPYLREHLIGPMAQVKRQVSENHHHNSEPTVLDRIDDVGRDVRALSRVFDEHLSFSDRWVGLTEREIALIQAEMRMVWEQIRSHHPDHKGEGKSDEETS